MMDLTQKSKSKACVEPRCTYNVAEGVATIGLANGANRNALDAVFALEILTHLLSAEGDSKVKAVVIESNVRSVFSLGPSLADLIACTQEKEGNHKLEEAIQLLNRVSMMLSDMTKLTIVAYHGCAMGGGVNLFLGCDIRLSTSSCQFAQRFVQMGITPDLGASYYLPRLMGRAAALEVLLSGRTFDGEEALAKGLVDEVVPNRKQLRIRARQLAGLAVDVPVHLVGAYKRLLRDGLRSPLYEQVEREQSRLLLGFREPQVIKNLESLSERLASGGARYGV